MVNFAEENVDVLIQYLSGTEQQKSLCMAVIQMILVSHRGTVGGCHSDDIGES